MESCKGRPLYRQGLTMLNKVKQEMEKKGWQIEICTVTNQEEIFQAGKEVQEAIWNQEAEEGIAASVRIGAEEAKKQEADAAAYFVADQPWLRAESVCRFLEAFSQSEKGIGRVRSEGIAGNPVIFDQKYIEALCSLCGDQGGRQVIQRYPEDIMYVEIDQKEQKDIDYPYDLIEE